MYLIHTLRNIKFDLQVPSCSSELKQCSAVHWFVQRRFSIHVCDHIDVNLRNARRNDNCV